MGSNVHIRVPFVNNVGSLYTLGYYMGTWEQDGLKCAH